MKTKVCTTHKKQTGKSSRPFYILSHITRYNLPLKAQHKKIIFEDEHKSGVSESKI